MIFELRDIVISYCQSFDDVLLYLGYQKHLNSGKIKLPKFYQLPTIFQSAKDNHLLSVCYLHSIGHEFTPYSIQIAHYQGHLDMVQYLLYINKKSSGSQSK